MIKFIKGNIFNSKCQTLVNTVNCQGVMGKGIALEFSYRFPDMVKKYKKLCEENKITIGRLWVYKAKDIWVLNFPTKNDWKQPSKLEYLDKGLKNFVTNYKKEGIKSIAFPQLGSGNGELAWQEVSKLMESYLSGLGIPIEFYIYDSNAEDVLYKSFLKRTKDFTIIDLKVELKLKEKQATLLFDAVRKETITNFANLRNIKGLGKGTISRLYLFAKGNE